MKNENIIEHQFLNSDFYLPTCIISEALDSLDLETMTKSERLILIQLGLPYIVTKPQIEEPVQEQQKFQIEIIKSLSNN